MVSSFWINAYSGFATSWGVSPSAMALIFSFVFSLLLTVMIIAFLENEHRKQMGVILFYGFLGLFTFLGAIDWYTYALSLVIMLGIWYAIGGKDEHGG